MPDVPTFTQATKIVCSFRYYIVIVSFFVVFYSITKQVCKDLFLLGELQRPVFHYHQMRLEILF